MQCLRSGRRRNKARSRKIERALHRHFEAMSVPGPRRNVIDTSDSDIDSDSSDDKSDDDQSLDSDDTAEVSSATYTSTESIIQA